MMSGRQEKIFVQRNYFILQLLLKKASEEQKKDLLSGYNMLTNPKIMGERFKFFVMHNHKSPEYIPSGIVPPDEHKPTKEL